MGNCDTHLFLGSKTTKTVEYFSKALGEKTISRTSTSKSKDKDGHKSGTSDSEQIMARALMTPDELRRMSMDYCIIYEKGIKPVKAKKVFFFKTNMIKEFNKFKLDHNNFDGGKRGIWRKFNPYNPDEFVENENKDLNVESLDDLFEEDEKEESKPIEAPVSESKVVKKEDKPIEQNSKISQSDLDELFDDDFGAENTEDSKEDEILDIQKELEAKFDELFGSSDDE